MNAFDLLFLIGFLASLIALAAAAYASLLGRASQAFSILRAWLILAAAYLTVSVAVAFLQPQKILAPGEPWCFDDWCLTVENARRAGPDYSVDLLISSRAKRATQRANGAWIYLRDENDRHYEPLPADVLLDVNSALAKRLPSSVRFKFLSRSANWA